MKELTKKLSKINIRKIVESKNIHGQNRGEVYTAFYTILDGEDFGMKGGEAIKCLKGYDII